MYTGRFLLAALLRILIVTTLCQLNTFHAMAAGSGSDGSISGIVRDGSGSAVADADLELRSVAQGTVQHSATNRSGFYSFMSLPVGEYELTVGSAGFATQRFGDLRVAVDGQVAMDVVLKPQAIDEQVTVTGESSARIDVSDTQMGDVIDATAMSAVPLNGRSFTDLLALQTGVVPVNSQPPNAVIMAGVSSTAPSGSLNPGNQSVNGQRESDNGFAVNGANVEEDLNMGTAVVPNLDSIQEFRILTNNFDPEHGNYAGGQVIVVTKSGTSRLHGSAFEFLRNTKLDARNYFASQRAPFHQNQFGGTLGGPVLKQKLFFFADYQGTRNSQGIDTGRIDVPGTAERGGDFSAVGLSGSVIGPYWAQQLTDRIGYRVQAGEPYTATGCASTSACVFPNSIIPQQAFSPVAKNLLEYIPQPNITGAEFETSAYKQGLSDDKAGLRVDAPLRNGSLSFYYFADDYTLDNPYPIGQGGASVPGFDAFTYGRSQLLSANYTATIRNNTVNDFHLSYLRDASQIGVPHGGVGPTLASQGFVNAAGGPSIVTLDAAIEGIENITFNSFALGVDITGTVQDDNLYQVSDSISHVVGKHLLKFGGEYHYDEINNNPDATFNGTFNFTGSETGVDFADYLLGIPSQFVQSNGRRFYLRDKYAALYGQDSWRVRDDVTLNFGLRWDVIAPWYEKYNQFQTLVAGQQSEVYPGAPRGLLFPTDKGVSRGLSPVRFGNVSPRIGVAYAPRIRQGMLHHVFGNPGQSTVKAGYGLYYTAFSGLSAGVMYAVPPFGYNYVSPAIPLFSDPFINAKDGTANLQPYPSTFPKYGATRTHPDNTVDWSKFVPVSADPAFSPDNKVAYAEHYMLSFERQLGGQMRLMLSYAGSQAHHQLVVQEANPGDPQLCLQLASAGCGPFGENGVYTSAAGTRYNSTRAPFGPNFGSDTYQRSIGNANFNALEACLHRSSPQTTLLLSYTYGKSIDDSSNLGEQVSPFDLRVTRAISSYDLRHNFVASYSLSPKLSRFVGGPGRLVDGWSLTGTTRFVTGLPITLLNNTDTSLTGTFANGVNNNLLDTPQVAPGDLKINHSPRSGVKAFNTALFTVPTLGTFGNTKRRYFYGPGMANYDLALLKTVPIHERTALELRLESFNTFNHAQFFGPVSTQGNISSQDFGTTTQAQSPRLLQLGARLTF